MALEIIANDIYGFSTRSRTGFGFSWLRIWIDFQGLKAKLALHVYHLCHFCYFCSYSSFLSFWPSIFTIFVIFSYQYCNFLLFYPIFNRIVNFIVSFWCQMICVKWLSRPHVGGRQCLTEKVNHSIKKWVKRKKCYNMEGQNNKKITTLKTKIKTKL